MKKLLLSAMLMGSAFAANAQEIGNPSDLSFQKPIF